MPQQPRSIISIRNVSKRFGATQALSNVSFDIRDHEVLALLGANGAGKSTIIKILAKIYSADSGEITGPDNSSIGEMKFAFIHQDLGLVEWMSVGESVALGSATHVTTDSSVGLEYDEWQKKPSRTLLLTSMLMN